MNDFSSGIQFDFTYAPGTSAEQILAFEMAGEVWSSYLNDDVSISIYVESTNELPDEVIGAALPGKKKKEKYEKVKDALREDITSSDDQLAFANLPSDDKEFSILVNGQQLDKTKEFRLTNANAKSLDLLNDDRDKLDGYILVNDLTNNPAVGWDYDALRSTGNQGNDIDLLSVAMHEVGHVLGFVSGIDDNEWLNVLTKSQEDEKKIEGKDFKFASPLDLYRYSDSSPEPGEIDLSMGGNPFFSIDGGDSNLGNFANGDYTQFGGDGYQASHWEQYSSQGIMNPVLPRGERRKLSSLDLTAMDVIGWDINTAAAPSWSEMYANATAGAETANIQDREKDVKKLIQESGYDVRRSRYSRGRRYSFQLGGFWQFTTIDAVNNPEEIEAVTEDASVVPTEVENLNPETELLEVGNVDPTNVVNPDDLAVTNNQLIAVNETEANELETSELEIISDNSDPVQVDPSIVENSNNIPADAIVEPETPANDTTGVDSSNQGENAEETIADDNNSVTDLGTPLNTDNEVIVTDNLEVQPEVEIADNDQEEVLAETVETEGDRLTNIVEPVAEQPLNTLDPDSTAAILAESDRGDGLNSQTESVAIDNDDLELSDNDNEDDEESETIYLYTPGDRYLDPQYVTGIENNGQDSLLY